VSTVWDDHDDYTNWLNSLMQGAPSHYDDDVAMEELVLRYMRDLEALVAEAHRITYVCGHGDTAFWDALERVDEDKRS
jgi:hypothetical protein